MESLAAEAQKLLDGFDTFQNALLTAYLTTFGFQDASAVQKMGTSWSAISVLLLCIFNFLLIVIMLNLIITLMGDLFKKIKGQQEVVFLKNRAGVEQINATILLFLI